MSNPDYNQRAFDQPPAVVDTANDPDRYGVLGRGTRVMHTCPRAWAYAPVGPTAEDVAHPAWPAFREFVARGGVVRRDLLGRVTEDWRVVWDVFRAGYGAGPAAGE